MELSDILKQVEGFTPPDVTFKIEKVWDYKSGHGDNGPWSFQDIQVAGTNGRIKLKGLPEFPKDREGLTVTIRANQSKQHGLTGMKVAHEEYNGKTYDKLVVTNSAKWEFANPSAALAPAQTTAVAPSGNGKHDLTYAPPMDNVEPYYAHLVGCATLAEQIAGLLKVTDQQALQACFATVCIDTKNRGILLPKPAGGWGQNELGAKAESNGHSAPPHAAPWDPAMANEHDPVDDY